MPMWQHNRPKTPPPQPRPRAPRAYELSALVLDAVIAGETDTVRKVMDTAFWEKVAFKPDSYHLLQAALKDDRKMVTLLTSYGATFTPDEAKHAIRVLTQEKKTAVLPALRAAGIRTNYTPAELEKADALPFMRWAHRAVTESRLRGRKNDLLREKELEDLVAALTVNAVWKGDMDRAKYVMYYRDPKRGAGTKADPYDLNLEFRRIMDASLTGRGSKAVEFLDKMLAEGYAIRPVELTSADIILSSSLAVELDKRGLLKKDAKEARRDLLADLTWMQENTEIAGTAIDIDKEDLARHRRGFVNAITAMFDREHPATVEEAESFITLHEMRSKVTPEALAYAEHELLKMGFFNSPAWTPARLRRLAAAGDLPDTSLKKAFNSRAAVVETLGTPVSTLLSNNKLSVILDAHDSGLWAANAADTLKIVNYLFADVKKDIVPDYVSAALKRLVKGGADFSAVDPMKYLGRDMPGFAKALLDAGAVKAEKFSVDVIQKKTGGGLQLVLPPGADGYAYTEFACQLILETAEPLKYIPKRGETDISYQKSFIKEWVEGLSRRNLGKITYRKPPAPPKGPKI